MNQGKPVRALDSILQAIGNTPLVRLRKIAAGVPAAIYAKVESLNPGGSVKDRIGIRILEEAERQGLLKPGSVIVESTSGNTGMGLAIAAAVKGYRAIFTMPDKMSKEKISLLKALGAEVVVTPTAVPPESPESYYEVAKRIVRETPGAFLANQYHNPVNPEAHYESTGPELWEQTAGQIDVFVASMGTGGTISGTGKFLKEKNPNVKVVGADPDGSILREYFYTKRRIPARTYKVEGIGEDFIPSTTHFEYIDEIEMVNDRDSLNMARRIGREEGIFVGGSSGTALVAALRVAARLTKNHVVVVLFPDTGERYLSKVHNDEWMRDNRLLDTRGAILGDVLRGKGGAIPSLVTIQVGGTGREALELIRTHDVSQLPVVDGNKTVGTVTEGRLLGSILENSAFLDADVKEVMDRPLPVLHSYEKVESAMKLLADKNAAVLVEDDDRLFGILTRIDLIEYIAP